MRNLAAGAKFTLAAALFVMAGNSAQASLVAYYSLNGNVNDSSGNNYNGTVSGTTAYTAGLNGFSAFSFNGSTSINTTTTDNLGLVNSSFKVIAAVNLNHILTDQPIFGGGFPGTDDDLHLIVRNGSPYMGFYSDDTASSTVLSTNTWYTLAFVFDIGAGTQSIYVNGVLDTQSSGHSPFGGTGEVATIGSAFDGDFSGAITDVQVFNTALSQSEIVAAAAPEPRWLGVAGMIFLAGLSRLPILRRV